MRGYIFYVVTAGLSWKHAHGCDMHAADCEKTWLKGSLCLIFPFFPAILVIFRGQGLYFCLSFVCSQRRMWKILSLRQAATPHFLSVRSSFYYPPPPHHHHYHIHTHTHTHTLNGNFNAFPPVSLSSRTSGNWDKRTIMWQKKLKDKERTWKEVMDWAYTFVSFANGKRQFCRLQLVLVCAGGLKSICHLTTYLFMYVETNDLRCGTKV